MLSPSSLTLFISVVDLNSRKIHTRNGSCNLFPSLKVNSPHTKEEDLARLKLCKLLSNLPRIPNYEGCV